MNVLALGGCGGMGRLAVRTARGFDLEAAGEADLEAIACFRGEYADPIRAIAPGRGLAPWQVAALNARTEIMHRRVSAAGGDAAELSRVGECTAVCAGWFFPGPLRIGTLCSAVMDLRKREMHITPANPRSHPFECLSLSREEPTRPD